MNQGPILAVDWGLGFLGRRYHEIGEPHMPVRQWKTLRQLRREAGRRGVVLHYLNHQGEYVPFRWFTHPDTARAAKRALRAERGAPPQ